MSDHIPIELQAEIIKRVPIKPLLTYRSVSKQWKSLIDSPEFGADYCIRQSQPRLLIRYIPIEKNQHYITSIHNGPNYKYVSVSDDNEIDDDYIFDKYHFPSTALPTSVNNLNKFSKIVGCSHGLFCFYGSDYRDRSYMAVLWNPWIRKFVYVSVPNVMFKRCETVLGFGVSPRTKEPKIVKINSFVSPEIVDTSVFIPWRVSVFTLSSRRWRSPLCGRNSMHCRNSIRFDWSQVDLDGVIYWHAFDVINVGGRCRFHHLIMSFDLSSEKFEEICLPDNLARLNKFDLSISKRLESVVVLEVYHNGTSYGVWLMGQGVTKSFTKLFNIMTPDSTFYTVCGFMRNGEAVIDYGSDVLFGYNPCSERHKDLGIVGKSFSFSVKSYVETLLLIDQ